MGSAPFATVRPRRSLCGNRGVAAVGAPRFNRRPVRGPPRAAENYLMSRKMLIDAAHAEETRVVVLVSRNSTSRARAASSCAATSAWPSRPPCRPPSSNGGNRHGFLAFNEIHPDYYHSPARRPRSLDAEPRRTTTRTATHRRLRQPLTMMGKASRVPASTTNSTRSWSAAPAPLQDPGGDQAPPGPAGAGGQGGARQQGAAPTTYLSLAGRYCVLMPNTDRGGGISRKITTAT